MVESVTHVTKKKGAGERQGSTEEKREKVRLRVVMSKARQDTGPSKINVETMFTHLKMQ